MSRPRRAPRRAPRTPASGLGGEQVEGRHAVLELLRAGKRRTREIWLAEGNDPAPVLAEIVELAGTRRVPLRRTGRGMIDGKARTSAPQGVIASADPLPEHDLDDLAGPGAFLLALDGVTDPHNVGALLRSAQGAGVTGVLLRRPRAPAITPAVAKAAAGAIEHVPLALVAGIPGALATLRDRGVWSVGLDAAATTSVFELAVATEPVVVVVGAEDAGLSRLTRQRCDVVARIPLEGSLTSLNAAVAGAVAMFAVARARNPGRFVPG